MTFTKKGGSENPRMLGSPHRPDRLDLSFSRFDLELLLLYTRTIEFYQWSQV